MRKPALLCLLPLVLGGATAHATEVTQVYLSDGELAYVGHLDARANAQLFALYDSLADKPTVLSIRSTGGATDDGLALGRWVRDHKLDVKVLEYCMSSCANYVFPAGVRKVVSNFAVIGFHGGLSSTTFDFSESTKTMLASLTPEKRKALLDQLDASLNEAAKNEQAYLQALGVRSDYVTLGQKERYRGIVREHPTMVGWTYSLEDFGRLGVHGITVINPPWRPGSALTDMSFFTLAVDD